MWLRSRIEYYRAKMIGNDITNYGDLKEPIVLCLARVTLIRGILIRDRSSNL